MHVNMKERSVDKRSPVDTFPSLNFISLLKSCVAGEAGTVKQFEYLAGKWPDSRRIDFRSPFSGTPTLTYGLYFLDSYYAKNLRIDTVVNWISVDITLMGQHCFVWCLCQLDGMWEINFKVIKRLIILSENCMAIKSRY